MKRSRCHAGFEGRIWPVGRIRIQYTDHCVVGWSGGNDFVGVV